MGNEYDKKYPGMLQAQKMIKCKIRNINKERSQVKSTITITQGVNITMEETYHREELEGTCEKDEQLQWLWSLLQVQLQ